VAEVDGRAITRAELRAQVRVFQSVRPEAADDLATRRQVLDHLVTQQLLLGLARREGLDRDPALRAEIERRRGELRAGLERTLADAKAQLATLDESVEAKTLLDALAREPRPGLTVTARELKAAYAQRSAQGPVGPFGQVRDQLYQQLLLDRLAEQARGSAVVVLHPEALQ